ncbi:MAG: iron complex transport system ATP-binding protein [Crocinitomix sp.]|jgi:iron complex transport system ATP-binding protein
MLAFNQLKIAAGARHLFAVDRLQLQSGIVALVGRNGTGKSTFLKTIIGLHHDFSGEILVDNKSIESYRQADLAKEIAIVYSKSSIFGSHTGRDVLMLGRLPYQNAFAKETAADREQVSQIIDLLQLEKFIDQEFSVLSDGEKQLIMIGRAVVQDTKIILLDEPAAFLDLVNRHKLMQVLQGIARSSEKLILFSTHQMDILPKVCQAVLLIDQNELRLIEDPKTFIPTIYKSFGMDNLETDEV